MDLMDRREVALKAAAQIAPIGATSAQLISAARKIEAYLSGQDQGPQPPPETDPDFAEVDGPVYGCANEMPRTRRQMMAESRSVINSIVEGMSAMPITPNDVTRGRRILIDMLNKNGVTMPFPYTVMQRDEMMDDIARTILRNYLDGPCE